jgi:DNA-binding transcriptional LysR family regulator
MEDSMELRYLQTFRTVASLLSVTQAAAVLHYAQSSVSDHLHALEDEFGVKLFDRLGKRLVLTQSGHRLLDYADHMIRLTEEAHLAIPGGEEPAGTLVLSAPETLCSYRLPLVLQRFRQHFPQVQLSFRPNVCTHLRQMVTAGEVDVAFLLETLVEDPNLTVEPLRVEPLVVVSSPEHRLAHLEHVYPADITGEAFLATVPGCSYRVLFERALAEGHAQPAMVLEFHSIEVIKQCVMSGMGVAVLPAIDVAREAQSGHLAVLSWAGPELQVVTQMVRHKDKWLSPALKAFLRITRDVLVGSQTES